MYSVLNIAAIILQSVLTCYMYVMYVQHHAYPADELMPLSCKGRYRGSEPSRGDIDDALGK